jgi:hypothetical protein
MQSAFLSVSAEIAYNGRRIYKMSNTPLHDTGIQIEQISQALANFITESMPDVKERLYALMNLEQTMLWYYQYHEKQRRIAEAEANEAQS